MAFPAGQYLRRQKESYPHGIVFHYFHGGKRGKARGAIDPKQVTQNLWMGDAELHALASDGHVVGLHSYNHPTTMAKLTLEEQRDEYAQNFAHLQRAPPPSLWPKRSRASPTNSSCARRCARISRAKWMIFSTNPP